MIQGIDPTAQRFLVDLGRIQDRLARAQREISSGLRVNVPSDDADQVSNILWLRANLERTSQIRRNLGRIRSEVDTAEQVVQTAVKVLERINQLGVQGATGTQTAESRAAIADEVKALHEQLVRLSGTAQEGRFIFHGDSDQTAPYTLDPARLSGASVYDGAAATRQALHPGGTTFAYAKTAQEIFDSATPGENVFEAVTSLKEALEGNDPTGIANALTALRGAQNHLNAELASYGTVQNVVTEATDTAAKMETQYQTTVSNLQDADITAAILELNQAKFHSDTALSAQAKLPKTSLFDFL